MMLRGRREGSQSLTELYEKPIPAGDSMKSKLDFLCQEYLF